LEEENQVYGKNADAEKNLESEDFNFCHQNKEKAKKDIDTSAKELVDFIDELIKDVPDPSEEEKAKGIEKILQGTHPEEAEIKPVKSKKNKKTAFKVLFIAAVLSVVGFSCLYAVGNTHNISIENGFISFAKDTVQVVFFGKDEEEFISVDSLLKDLEKNGFKDILFPEVFITNSDVYKVNVPEYYSDEVGKQVTFNIHSKDSGFKFIIHSYNSAQQAFGYMEMDDLESVMIGDISVSVFEYENEPSVAEFVYGNYRYYIRAEIPYSEMMDLVKTFK